MATSTLKTRIKHKIDTASNWASSNLVPLEGELVIYKGDKPQIKVGDGSTAVGSLPFIKAGSDTTITQALTSGTEIGSISIDGVATKLYAPSTIAWGNITSKPSYYDAKAIKSISRSGTTFTATHLDGTTSTFTQQDNNTTYSFAPGSAGGTIAVNGTDIYVQGLKESALDPLYSKYVLHDIFAFCRAATPIHEASTDGTTWTELPLQREIFDQKDRTNTYIFRDGYVAHRWTWDSTVFSYAGIRYLMIKYAYSSSQPRSRLIMEAKPDSTWVTIVDTEYNANSSCKTIPVNGYSTGPIRITIQKADFSEEGTSIPLVALQCFSHRPGDQGQGIEYESPIDWDVDRNITIPGKLSVSNAQLHLYGKSYADAVIYFENSTGKHSAYWALSETYGNLYTNGATHVNINGQEDTPLLLKSGTSGTYLKFINKDNTSLGWFGYQNQNQPVISYGSDGSNHIILHDGNYTSYCAKASHTHNYLPLSGGTITGALNLANGTWNKAGDDCAFGDSNTGGSFSIQGLNANTNLKFVQYGGSNYATITYNGSNLTSSVAFYGAVWNDYAEYRQTVPHAKPGQIVTENGDGTQRITTERLQRGCNVVSDTFGFAIGETDECKTPIACAGRALVYTYENRYDFQPGEAVCSGPNGTVSRMTREEMINNPDCIVGFVSEIPEYKVWGTGNVEVDGRIWIKVK